jgi:ribosomal protein L40E
VAPGPTWIDCFLEETIVTLDDRHAPARDALRAFGPILVAVGLIFTVIGIGSFFASFGSFEPPRYFWCAFVGLPLLGVGVGITKFAFLGAVTRYVASETAPVAKDTINYVAHGTKDAVREIASAVGEGLRSGGAPAAVLRCAACNAENDADARFCKGCGAVLTKGAPCSSCGEVNAPDARYCDNCGKAL